MNRRAPWPLALPKAILFLLLLTLSLHKVHAETLPQGPQASQEGGATLEIINNTGSTSLGTDFKWSSFKVPVYIYSSENGEAVARALIEGRYQAPLLKLLVTDSETSDRILTIEKGRFSTPVVLSGETTRIRLVAVCPDDRADIQEIQITFPGWENFQKAESPQTTRRFFYGVSLGLTSLSYQEGSRSDYHATATTLKAFTTRSFLSSQWDIGANFFVTLGTLSSNLPASSVRTLGANFRFGYVFPQVSSPWRLALLGGVYYTTMFVTDNAFGYRNLIYPQLFPTIKRTLSPTQAISGYLKYVPTNAGILPSWKEKELAIGATWEQLLPNRHPLTVSVDLSTLSLTIGASKTEVSLNSGSLSVGYGL